MKFNYKPNGRTFKYGSVYFYIILNPQKNYIDEVFNSSEDLGFNELEFYEMDEFLVNENYSGIYIAYKLQEFQ